MQQRINISLPEETVRLIDRLTSKGNRSRLIEAAVGHYVRSLGKTRLRRKLTQGYRKLSQSSLEIAAEWFPADEDAWQKGGL